MVGIDKAAERQLTYEEQFRIFKDRQPKEWENFESRVLSLPEVKDKFVPSENHFTDVVLHVYQMNLYFAYTTVVQDKNYQPLTGKCKFNTVVCVLNNEMELRFVHQF